MRKKRHNYSPEEKVFILKRHMVGREAVSDLCDEYQLQPKIFYGWQKQFFEQGASVLPVKERASKRPRSVGLESWKRNSAGNMKCFRSFWRSISS